MGRGRKLTPAERVLWNTVARSARPLSGRPPEPMPPEAETESRKLAAGVGPKAMGLPQDEIAAPPRPTPRRKVPPALQPIEKPVRRKIARGRLPIDGRIDLHGLMQADAQDLLHAFLVRAHEGGFRHVLVITGKGSSMGSEGVLKRAVPQWLAMPGFRSMVSGYETAARGHGGEGALYVRLKRRRDGQ